MDLQELNEETVDILKYIQNIKFSVLYFTASWCGPCKKVYPNLCKINNEVNKIEIFKVDIDKNEEISNKFNIKSVPTFILFKNGNIVNQCNGSNINQLGQMIIKEISK